MANHNHDHAFGPEVAQWVKSSGPIDYQQNLQVPKPALLHSQLNGPAQQHDPAVWRQFSDLMGKVRQQKAGQSLDWISTFPVKLETQFTLRTILSSPHFYRMEGISQTLTDPDGRFTTRKDHNDVVGWVAGYIAFHSGIGNPMVAYLGGLTHDFGHAPMHHMGELELDAFAKTYDMGYSHARRGAMILNELALPGFVDRGDLSHLAGMAETHSWPLKAATNIEAAYVTIADRIGYVATDLVDCLRSGLITTGQVLEASPRAAAFLGLDKHPAFRNNQPLTEKQLDALQWHIARTFSADCAQTMRETHMPGLSLEAAESLGELRLMNSMFNIGRKEHLLWQDDVRHVYKDYIEFKMQNVVLTLNVAEDEALLIALSDFVNSTEKQFFEGAQRDLGHNIKDLARSPLGASAKHIRPLTKRQPSPMLAIDQLIAVDLRLPTTDGGSAAMSFSDAMRAYRIATAKYPIPVVAPDGRKVPPTKNVLLSTDPELNADRRSDIRPQMILPIDGLSGKGKSRRLDQNSDQARFIASAAASIVDGFRKVAAMHSGIESNNLQFGNARVEQAVKVMFDGQEVLRDRILDTSKSSTELIADIEELARDYALAQPRVGATRTFEIVQELTTSL